MARRPKPWYRKARGSWFVMLDGRQHNLGPDKKQAYERFYELMRQPAAKKVSPHSMAAIIDEFLDWTKKHRAADTFEWYRYRLERFAQRYPDLAVGDVRPFHAEKWVDSYDLSVTSRRNYLRSVKRCLKWATQQGYIDRNPVADLEIPTGERKEVLITADEYAELLAAIPDASFRDLVITTWETGCRPQESLIVEARHVEPERQRWVFPRQEAKGKKQPRIVYLSDAALEITRRLVEANPRGPLFRNSSGKPWTSDAVNCGFDRIQFRMGKAAMARDKVSITDDEIDELIPMLKSSRRVKGRIVQKSDGQLRAEARRKLTQKKGMALVPRYSLYALRHSWATRALQAGLDGLTVAVLMGHSDPSTLARVYQHLSHNPEHMLSLARKAAG